VKLYEKIKYLGKKYYPGRNGLFISYVEGGDALYCHQCGNLANGLIYEKILGVFNIKVPICRPHYQKQYIQDTNIKIDSKDAQLLKLNPYINKYHR